MVLLGRYKPALSFSRLVCLVSVLDVIGEQRGEETSGREEPLVRR